MPHVHYTLTAPSQDLECQTNNPRIFEPSGGDAENLITICACFHLLDELTKTGNAGPFFAFLVCIIICLLLIAAWNNTP